MTNKVEVLGHRVLIHVDDEGARTNLKAGEAFFSLDGKKFLIKDDEAVIKDAGMGYVLTSAATGFVKGKIDPVEEAREKQGARSGVVVQVGPTAFKDIYDGLQSCKVGDRIYFSRYEGMPLSGSLVDGDEDSQYILLNDIDVLVILH